MLLRYKEILLIIVMLTAACGSHSRHAASTVKSRLSRAEAQLAFDAAMTTVSYLPFGHIQDGCYARAYYMAMEAASLSLPVSVQYVYSSDASLTPGDDTTRWSYHAATMVWIEGDVEPTIIDPAMFDEPIMRSVWLAKMQAEQVVDLSFSVGSTLAFVPGVHPSGPTQPSQLIHTIETMPDFTASDIAYACSVMDNYISIESGFADAALATKSARLRARTKELVGELDDLGLVSGAAMLSPNHDSCY